MGFISKHLILLSLLFYLASCVEGEQRVSVITDEGVSGPSPLSIIQTAIPGSPPALPIPPNFAFTSPYCDPNIFCPGDVFPFLPDTSAILAVQISNPSNLPFTLEWSINNTVAYAEINPTQSSIPIGEPPPGATYTDYFSGLGFYTIVSSLKDSSGLLISNLVWSVEIVGTDPTYVTQSFSPRPAPTPYVGSPFSASDSSTQTISVTISNPSVTNFINNWYLDGALQSSSNQTGPATVSFSFVPSQMTTGNHTVVAQLTDDQAASPTIYNTSTWSFEVTELPQFSTFTNPQLPSPAPFADIEFGSTQTVNLDPNPLYNPSNAAFTLYWEVDGAIDASATFNGDEFNNDPPAFVISATDTNFQPGRHSVVAILFDESFGTSTFVDSANWNFEVVFPPPATLDNVYPATNTQVISVSSIPMNGTSPMGGFFVGPSTDDSRGIPMNAGSTNTFCVEVSDGRGVGFPGPGTGVLVQYRYSDFARINATALQFPLIDSPPPLCLNGSGSSTPTDGVPNFTLSVLGDTFITATIIDKLSLQTIGVVNWNITVTVPNTQPTLVIAAPFASTTTTATVPQDATRTYSFTVLDQDCHPSLSKLNCYSSTFSMVNPVYAAYPGVALDGTNTYYGGSSAVTPDCVRDYSYNGIDKFSCVIMIPSNNGLGPISSTGTYQVNAQVNNLSIWVNGTPTYPGTPTNYFDPMVVSDMMTWNLTVVEANTGGPVLINQRASGPATPTTDSYMYIQGNPLAVASTATEGDPILFNFVVDDPQKDNYKIKYFYNTSSATATFTEFNATPTYTYSIADNPINGAIPASKTIAPFPLPFGLVTGAPSATITFKVQLTDVPDSASPITNSFNFFINVTNVNPPPVVVTGTERPAYSATGTVVQGFPYTMWADITDASVGLGSGLKWQWMVNQNGAAACASKTAVSWKSITGADEGGTPLPAPQTATLTWSAPSDATIPATATFCFRNCIGDDDSPGLNTSNCSPAMAGPWIGGIKGVPADIPSAATTGYLQPNMGDTAVWADPGNVGDIYGIHLRGNSIFLMKYDYQLDGTVIQSNGSFPTRQAQTATTTVAEGAYDVSMTGNNNFIFVSYVFNNPGILPPFVSVPTNMVVRISKLNFSSVDYFFNDRVPLGVGQVVANNSAFWVPYINSSLGDTPFFFAGDGAGATTTINGSFGIPLPVDEIESREQGGRLYMAIKLDDGTVNLYSYNLLASVSTPTLATTDNDIFFAYFVPFTDMSLAVGPGTNLNVFVAGIDGTTKSIFYGKKAIGSLNNSGVLWDIESISTSTYPKTYDLKGLNAVASNKDGEVLLGFIKEQTLARSTFPFAGLYLLKSDGTNSNLSAQINQGDIFLTGPPQRFYTSADFALTNVIPNFVIGTAGAVPNENQKDTLWFRYWDFSTDRMIIVNIEDETFSGSTPTTGNAWSTPWFQQ